MIRAIFSIAGVLIAGFVIWFYIAMMTDPNFFR